MIKGPGKLKMVFGMPFFVLMILKTFIVFVRSIAIFGMVLVLNSVKLCFYAVPEGSGETTELEVYNFTGEGGVALSMYNTDEVCLAITG